MTLLPLLIHLAIILASLGEASGLAEQDLITDARYPRYNLTSVSNILDRSKRFIRRTRGQRRSEACDMLIAIDEPLYVTYNRDLTNLTDMAQLYVKQLNEIYHSTVLMEKYNNIYFRIKEIRILYDFCTECNHTQQVFLEEFTKMDTSDFCLAHIFTFRDFPAGIQGLAYKGTVCSASHNTGFTTFLNHQVQSSASDSVMTFAHEIGHNMGAEHDEDAGCTSAFIMSESGSSKRSHFDQEFSPCSITAIHDQIDHIKTFRHRNCFRNRLEKSHDEDFSVCGDLKVEGEEECDCGMSYRACNDPCCYAAHIAPYDLVMNASAIPCRRHASPTCLKPFRSALTFGVILPWIFIGICVILLLIGLCYDWRHHKKCFKHVTDHKIIEDRRHRRISKSEPRSPTSIQLPIIKPKAPPPPPPLTVPYLPPMRSQSQPPMPMNNRVSNPPPLTIPPKPEFKVSRPSDPPPPVPMSPPKAQASNGPPVVPYGTRPHISEVAYLKKKFEEEDCSNDKNPAT